MHASLPTYRVGSGSVDVVMRRVDRDFAEALSQEPGFVAYHAIDTGNDMVMTISLFHDREEAEASNELAAQWVAEELRDFNVTRVGVIAGEAMVSRASAEILESFYELERAHVAELVRSVIALPGIHSLDGRQHVGTRPGRPRPLVARGHDNAGRTSAPRGDVGSHAARALQRRIGEPWRVDRARR